MQASTTYGTGNITTRTALPGSEEDPLDAFIRDRMRELKKQPRPAAAPRGPGGRAGRVTRYDPEAGKTALDRVAEQRARLQLDRERSELQAMKTPPRVQPRSGFNWAGYFVQPDQMNAFERQLYLPQGSGGQQTAENIAGGEAQSRRDALWEEIMARDRARGRTYGQGA